MDTVRSKNQKPTFSDLSAAAVCQQKVAASLLEPAEARQAAASRAEGLAVVINREVDQILAREREGGRFLRWVGRGWNALGKLKRVRRRRGGRGFKPLSWLVKFLAWSKKKMEQNVLS